MKTPGHEKLLGIVREHVDAARTDLTPGQRAKLAEAVADSESFETARNENWSFPVAGSAELKWHVEHALENTPDLGREVPTASQVARAQVADKIEKSGACDLQAKLTFAHRAAEMSDDERLAATKGLRIEAPTVSADTAPARKSDAEIDVILNARGIATKDLMSSQIRNYRSEIRKQLESSTSAGATVAEVMAVKGWKTLADCPNPETRIALARQQEQEKAARPTDTTPARQKVVDMDVQSEAFKRMSPQARLTAFRKAGSQ